MLLFIDNPLGVGFSYTDTGIKVNTTAQGSLHFNNFMVNFYNYFQNLTLNPLHIFGLSYAGHYVPSYAANFI